MATSYDVVLPLRGAIPVIVKAPNEHFAIGVDLSQLFPAGETISALTLSTDAGLGASIPSSSAVLVAPLDITGGTDGGNYLVRVKATGTTTGALFERAICVRVRNPVVM